MLWKGDEGRRGAERDLQHFQIYCRFKVLSMEDNRTVKQAQQQKHIAAFKEIAKLAKEPRFTGSSWERY